jgi:hypothetical protein
MPDYTLTPGDFLLIWADDETEQGMFHANFKISKEGEDLGIFGPEDQGYPAIDTLTFGEQQEDISYGRQSDGGIPWKFMDYATPGYSNISGASVDENRYMSSLVFWPNPCNSGLIKLEEESNIRIYNFTGQLCIAADAVDIIDVSDLPSGQYFVLDDLNRSGKLVVIK